MQPKTKPAEFARDVEHEPKSQHFVAPPVKRHSDSVGSFYQDILEATAASIACDEISLMLRQQGALRVVAGFGHPVSVIGKRRERGDGVAWNIMSDNAAKPVHLFGHFDGSRESEVQERPRCAVIIPLIEKLTIQGTLNCARRHDGFSEAEVELLRLVGAFLIRARATLSFLELCQRNLIESYLFKMAHHFGDFSAQEEGQEENQPKTDTMVLGLLMRLGALVGIEPKGMRELLRHQLLSRDIDTKAPIRGSGSGDTPLPNGESLESILTFYCSQVLPDADNNDAGKS